MCPMISYGCPMIPYNCPMISLVVGWCSVWIIRPLVSPKGWVDAGVGIGMVVVGIPSIANKNKNMLTSFNWKFIYLNWTHLTENCQLLFLADLEDCIKFIFMCFRSASFPQFPNLQFPILCDSPKQYTRLYVLSFWWCAKVFPHSFELWPKTSGNCCVF